ncbi:hypothetical protein A2531_01800 [Candidatus Falkowbacteria bacterium RIFOXYD2_FULL_34_120]|uniref:Uncharacterized protein n=1 Tax=Candidatus Falkowbacteria bacterium RIFOXYD2_FULL_34_120 TaxID=1798007 RepID=A0A1F5TLZ0_9BACT|nr:MAG: hypothetical protein A2500_05880 [Candidatus Falkowbacteria bacterium RIFOXYC12_FULL_34_55]OGF36820.1 MAG: hypothetical protein A2466_04470 [Candidatus Falkowbacteria bacterium RIFOXYC2_FULL_34_220]OGF38706.1 MAG: hypothetical protein A2515_01545 [Candidatus Falkowbacteria bacterium RIFOXYD12_FULL_34_57]OGF39940.1 MAG: hypothetical protein A2531_01800 [Candidatus Falkowbacteria bacterium RIFOXYD2_FULL_34_120]
MKNKIFKIWVDSDGDVNQGKYFFENTDLNKLNCSIERVYSNKTDNFAKNPKKIQDMLYLDKPDVIITYQENEQSIEIPVLSLEISEQTPMGQNTFQRFPRAVASAEQGVPFVIIFPEKDWVQRTKKESSGWEMASPFVFNGLKKLSEFHNIPVFSVNWACNEKKVSHKGYKSYDTKFPNMPDSNSEEMKKLFIFINLLIQNTLGGYQTSKLLENREIKELVEDLDAKRFSRGGDFLKKIPSASSGGIVNTKELKNYIEKSPDIKKFDTSTFPDYIKARDESLIFYSETNNFRADPYTGTMLVYDYSFCRYGKEKTGRHRNLIVHFPKISFSDIECKYSSYYERRCPFKPGSKHDNQYLALHLRDGCKFTKIKEFRIYFYFADIIILKDVILF